MLSDDLLLIFFAHSFKSTIHVSLHILIISLNMWYSVQYVCSSFYRPVYIFSVCSILPNLLYRPFIYYNKGLFSGNFYLPYHWIKPPFHKFPINDISPTYEIFFILDKLFFYHLRYKLEFIISSLLRL